MSHARGDAPEGDAGVVRLERRQGVAWITLDRPGRLNALAGDMRGQLRRCVVRAAEDERVDSLVITGAGEAFCAGADVAVMQELRRRNDLAAFHEMLHEGAEAVLALQAFPGLTIAAIHGVAAGAGLGLALSCDLRVATTHARLGASWSRLALVPDWGATFWLPRLVGPSHATDLVLTGRVLQAREAKEIGLVHRLVEPAELVDAVQEIARTAGALPELVQRTRALLRGGLEEGLEAALAREAEAQEERFLSDEAGEAFDAFRDQRPPRSGPE